LPHTICDVAIHTVNSLEITLILQPDRNDVKIGPTRSRENRISDTKLRFVRREATHQRTRLRSLQSHIPWHSLSLVTKNAD